MKRENVESFLNAQASDLARILRRELLAHLPADLPAVDFTLILAERPALPSTETGIPTPSVTVRGTAVRGTTSSSPPPPPQPASVSDEDLRQKITDAITTSPDPERVVVDLGFPGFFDRRYDVVRARAKQIARTSGWDAEFDGRSGQLVLTAPGTSTSKLWER